MELQEGTEEEHLKTLERANQNKIKYVWSGDLRNNYLRENLAFGVERGIISIEYVEDAQESGYFIKFLNE